MTRTSQWSAVTALIVVVLFVAAWFLLISPQRSAAADLRAQKVAQDDANLRLQQKITQLEVQQRDLPKQRARLAAISAHLPATPELPKLVRELDKEAKASGAVLVSLTPSVPATRAPGGPGAGAAAAPAPGAPAGSGAAAAPAPAPAGAPAGGGPYLQEIPISIKVQGSFVELEQFLNKVELLKRVVLTTTVAISEQGRAVGDDAPKRDGKGEDLEMVLTSKVFMATPLPAAKTGAGAPAPLPPAAPAR